MRCGGVGAPGDDGVAFNVDAAPACASGELGVFAGGDIYVGFTIVFGEFFEDDGAGGHVNAKGEGFGGEDKFNEAGGKKRFDGFFEKRQHPGVVCGDAAKEPFSPFIVAESVEVSGVKVRGGFGDVCADGSLLLVGGEHQIGVDALGDGTVAPGAGEDEADGRKEPCFIEGAYHLRAGNTVRAQGVVLCGVGCAAAVLERLGGAVVFVGAAEPFTFAAAATVTPVSPVTGPELFELRVQAHPGGCGVLVGVFSGAFRGAAGTRCALLPRVGGEKIHDLVADQHVLP